MDNRNNYTELMISIRKIVRAVNLESKIIEKDFGLSIPQLLTLKFLKNELEFKSTMKLLKEHLSLNASTVTGIITRLETKGFVARLPNPNDKRSTPIVLTSRGNELVSKTDESLHERMYKKSLRVSEDEFNQIIVSLETLIELFDINDIDASPIISGPVKI